MAASHTPGPWRLDPQHAYDVESYDGHFQIATIRDEDCDLLLDRQYAPRPSEAEANARLIAAAPDLLAGGKHLAVKLAEVYRACGINPTECQAIRDWLLATAKAEANNA